MSGREDGPAIRAFAGVGDLTAGSEFNYTCPPGLKMMGVKYWRANPEKGIIAGLRVSCATYAEGGGGQMVVVFGLGGSLCLHSSPQLLPICAGRFNRCTGR